MKKRKGFYQSETSKGHRDQKISKKQLLKWVYKQLQGFWFVDVIDEVSGEKKWYFVHETKKSDAFEGDEVLFEVQMFRGKEEAIIKKITQRSEHLIVGILQLRKTFAFVIPKNDKIGKDIFIPGKFIEWYREWAMVAVKILKWEGKNPEGRIVEILDDIPEGRRDIYTIAFEMGARKRFSEKVKQEVRRLQNPDLAKIKNIERIDVRNLLTYTIDGAESKDLDDALSIERTDTWYRLYVHIADVAEYVIENSELDREARKRATSIYLVDQVIPMLPSELSNGLCSLHPWEAKLTLTCEMELDESGRVLKSQVYESIIESDYRLTYREIDEILQPPSLEKRGDSGVSLDLWDSLQFWKTLSLELQKNIFLLKELSNILEKNATKRGSLDFDFPETKIILDETWVPLEYKKYERYDSYKIIEVCMVLANESIAKLFSKTPFLYRVHEEPDSEDIEKFLKLLEGISSPSQFSPNGRDGTTDFCSSLLSPPGGKVGIGGSASPRDIQSLLQYLQSQEKLEWLQKLVLRSMKKAVYSEKNIGHFWLSLTHYSHFTSPIRRYADLQIHRIIKETLTPPIPTFPPRGEKSELQDAVSNSLWGKNMKPLSPTGGKNLDRGRQSHYKEILPKIAQICSEKSDKAEKMEYKVRDMLACRYMRDKIGQSFEGKISGIIDKGFFIELENTIEWFVDISWLPYIALREEYSLVHQKSWERLKFWDRVEVEVSRVDMQKMRIEFELL